MKTTANSTILDHFLHCMDKGEVDKAKAIERGYNFLMDCFDLDVSFKPIEDDEGNEI